MSTTHYVDPNQREDLRNVYLAIHGSAIVTDIPDVAAGLNLKRSYVKELFEVLANHADRNGDAFIVLNESAGVGSNDTPHDWWQTSHTVDDHDNDMAQHWFDEHFPAVPTAQDLVPVKTNLKRPAPQTPLNATNPAGLPICLCGCKQPVSNRNRNYKPGHDARHAGIVARYIAEKDNEDTREAALAMLPTEALRLKADAMATRLLKKAAAKTLVKDQETSKRTHTSGPAVRPVTFEVGEVKIGRWVYPAERNSTSGSVTFTRKGKTEVASDKIAASFTKGA